MGIVLLVLLVVLVANVAVIMQDFLKNDPGIRRRVAKPIVYLL